MTRGRLWYATTLEIREGDAFQIFYDVRVRDFHDADCEEIVNLVGTPSPAYSWARSGSDATHHVSTSISIRTPAGDIVPPESRETIPWARVQCMTFHWWFGFESTITLSLVGTVATDGKVADTRIEVIPQGARVLAESWGRGGVRLFPDDAFRGVAAHAETPPGGGGVGAARELTVSYRRAASMTAKSQAEVSWSSASGSSGYGTDNKIFSVEGPDAPIGVGSGGSWSLGPLAGRYVTAGPATFAGLDPGTYTYRIEAIAGLRGNGSPVQPTVSSKDDVYVISMDADMPPCARTALRWREEDGHPVCGPERAQSMRAMFATRRQMVGAWPAR